MGAPQHPLSPSTLRQLGTSRKRPKVTLLPTSIVKPMRPPGKYHGRAQSATGIKSWAHVKWLRIGAAPAHVPHPLLQRVRSNPFLSCQLRRTEAMTSFNKLYHIGGRSRAHCFERHLVPG